MIKLWIFFTLILQSLLFSQGQSFYVYKNTNVNLKFEVPVEFSIHKVSKSNNKSNFSIKYVYRESKQVDEERSINVSATISIVMTKNKYDKTNKENKFYFNDSVWIAQSFGYGPAADVEAHIIDSDQWFGLEADTFTRYYYVNGGCATAAGNSYSFFAIREIDDSTNVFLSFENRGGTKDNIGKKVISSVARLE